MSKETYYFSHDYNARGDRKLIKLRLKYKMAGFGIYWAIIEMLYEESGEIPLSEIETIAGELREKESMVLSVINDFGLFENDGNMFWSNSVKRRLDKRLEKSEKAKESIRKRWGNTNVLRTNNDINTIKESKVKESKEKEIIKESNTPDLKNSNLYRQPKIPTQEEVSQAFLSAGGNIKMAEVFFNKNSAVGWFSRGSPITNFRNLIPSFIANWKENDLKNGNKLNNKDRQQIARNNIKNSASAILSTIPRAKDY